MNKLILKHFVLTDTNINDKKYYILCSTQQFTKDHYFVALYWAKATSDLHTGQEIDLINNAGFTPTNEPIFNIKAKYNDEDNNSQANRKANLEFCAKCLANSIKSMDYTHYIYANNFTNTKQNLQQYIHNKSDVMLNILLSLSDIADENATKDDNNEIVHNIDATKLWDEEREHFINETVNSITNMLYTMQTIQTHNTPDLDFIDDISTKMTPLINENLQAFNLMNSSLAQEYNAPVVTK